MHTRNNLLIVALLALNACAATGQKFDSPPGYDFSKPETSTMPAQLAEISGIAFFPGRADQLYAIQDEDGKLFFWKNGDPASMQHLDFGKHGDYEDLAITSKHIIVLESNGDLHVFPNEPLQAGSSVQTAVYKGLLPPGEYESLYADVAAGQLYVLCKQCKDDKQTQATTGYILNIDSTGRPTLDRAFSIAINGPSKGKPGKVTPLRPSAVTFNQATGEWYLLSGVHKMLIIADKDWKAKQVIPLDPALFTQPEGIATDIDNNLYISNEAGNSDAGTVIRFRRSKP
jgi:hypothetical protein